MTHTRPAGTLAMRTSAVAVALVSTVALVTPTSAAAQDWRTTTALRQISGEDELEVHVGYAAGKLAITPAEGNTLYRASLRYDAELFDPTVEYRPGVLRLDMDGISDMPDNDERSGEGRLNLELAREVPIDLDLEFGAAQADVELGGMNVRSLQVSTGASETDIHFSRPNAMRMEHVRLEVGAADFEITGLGNANVREVSLDGGVADITLDFSGEWRGNIELDVDMGLGSLTIRLPRDVGVRIEKDGFLASFGGANMEERGDAFYSDNWGSASHRLTGEITAAFGDITVEWID